MQPRAVSLRRLVKSYDGAHRAVDAVDLEVAAGEFVSFLGPSGSGKTTTLMMIAGFEAPTEGSIALDGQPIENVPAFRRDIGMVFQNYALFPHMSVARNVGFPLAIRRVGRAEADRRVEAALDMVGLRALAARRPSELSGGQQQRVALARALVFSPGLVLLDEPLGALDKALREHMQVELKRIHRDIGVTMIYVTHDQSEAMTMSDRIAVFNRGRIEQVGTPGAVYDAPATRFVAAFIGDSNLIEGRVAGPGRLALPGFGEIACPAATGAVGAPALALMRPELFDVAANGPHRFAIADRVHYGDSVLLIGDVNGQPLRVRAPGRVAGAAAGEACGLAFDPAGVRIVPG